MIFNCPPADLSAFKLPVHVAHVGVGHMHGGAILLPPKPVEVSTVPDMHMVLEEADKHLVMEEAVVPTAVQLGRAFQESCLRDVFSRF